MTIANFRGCWAASDRANQAAPAANVAQPKNRRRSLLDDMEGSCYERSSGPRVRQQRRVFLLASGRGGLLCCSFGGGIYVHEVWQTGRAPRSAARRRVV